MSTPNTDTPKPWFIFGRVPESPADPQEILIYNDIGSWGISASEFIAQAKAVPAAQPLRVRINSTGGNIFDALAMFNWLKARGNVETVVDGLAASSASLVAMAGTKRTMPSCAYLMVHNPWSGATGNGDQLRAQADLLDQFAGVFADIYAKATGMAKDSIQKLMDAESWIVGADALKGGWVTHLTDAEPIQASIAEGRYGKTPDRFLAKTLAPTPSAPSGSQGSGAPTHNAPNNTATMQKLLAALAQAGVISSPTLGEDAAVAELTTNLAALNQKVADAKAALDAQAKAHATSLVDAAVTEGRIKADMKDGWVAQILADANAAKLLAAVEKPKAVLGAIPVGPSADGTGKPKSLTEQCIEARAKAAAR